MYPIISELHNASLSSQVTNVIPQEFVPVLTMLAEDESLSYSYPEVRSTALEFLHQMDLDTYHTFRHAQEVCQSLKSSCGFLMELDDLVLTLDC